jgi:hypothetical protein
MNPTPGMTVCMSNLVQILLLRLLCSHTMIGEYKLLAGCVYGDSLKV